MTYRVTPKDLMRILHADPAHKVTSDTNPDAATDTELRNTGSLGGATPAYRLTPAQPVAPAPMPAAQAVILPLPPSVNHYLVSTGRGGRALSQEARNWKAAADIAIMHARLVRYDGPVAVYMHVYRERKAGDLDNRVKLTLDALNGIAWGDDAQVVELHAYRRDDPANPRVEVEIRTVTEVTE